MKYYFAPLEGITGYIYRNAHNKVFGNVDKYFTPFISPTINESFTSRELNDILPEHNLNINVVPQVLANNLKYFIRTMDFLKNFEYSEINLNLGCPSGTVVAKHKGAGFLSQREELDKFLYEIFSHESIKISIKTRIGRDSPDEFYELIKIFNKYPLEELIIHPRIQSDYYKNTPNMDIFKYALDTSNNPVCYNGDLFNVQDYKRMISDHPAVDRVMFGRGLIANPQLIMQAKNHAKIDKILLKSFHDEVLLGYIKILSGDKNVLFKMKEFWCYMIRLFKDSDKYFKKIRKSQRISEYESVINLLFNELEIDENLIKRF